MTSSEWRKVDFKQFINNFGNKILIDNAPDIMYSKKDKEHEAYNSLIAFFFIAGFLLIFIALTYFLASIYFSLTLFVIVIVVLIVSDVLLIFNVIKSNVYIKPLECWVEIYKGKSEGVYDHYCFTYYPIFSGKCHPNEALNIIYKLYQEEIMNSRIDITQIEIYLKINREDQITIEKIGYFFLNAEDRPFKDQEINRSTWKFFPFEEFGFENHIATGNWEHQYEWKNELEFDFDKLHNYAPWVIQRWDEINLKPLTEEYKAKIKWNLRYIESSPKLKPWEGDIEKQTYENPKAYKDMDIIKDAITKIIKQNREIEKSKDIKEEIQIFRSFFRDLAS
ncbi:MAG: hypothetical protein ACFFCE_05860 [Promethearchaeota archaeon]